MKRRVAILGSTGQLGADLVDILQNSAAFDVVPLTHEDADCADARAIQGLLEHWREVLVEIGYLDPAAPKKLLPRLNQLLNRARPTAEEVHILRGIARAASRK